MLLQHISMFSPVKWHGLHGQTRLVSLESRHVDTSLSCVTRKYADQTSLGVTEDLQPLSLPLDRMTRHPWSNTRALAMLLVMAIPTQPDMRGWLKSEKQSI